MWSLCCGLLIKSHLSASRSQRLRRCLRRHLVFGSAGSRDLFERHCESTSPGVGGIQHPEPGRSCGIDGFQRRDLPMIVSFSPGSVIFQGRERCQGGKIQGRSTLHGSGIHRPSVGRYIGRIPDDLCAPPRSPRKDQGHDRRSDATVTHLWGSYAGFRGVLAGF